MIAKVRVKPGEQYGNYVVIRLVRERNAWKAECRCGCGRIVVVQPGHLRSGHSDGCKSCGARKRFDRPGYVRAYPWKTIWCDINAGATKRSLEVSVDVEYVKRLLESQGYCCALSGIPIAFARTTGEHRRAGSTASLDRIDSGMGYVAGNLQWVHKELNVMKMDMPQNRFVELCKLVAIRQETTPH